MVVKEEIIFTNEHLKLQHVHEPKSNERSSCRTAMSLCIKSCYELPPGKVSNDNRVRVEKHGGMILIYHALINVLICKHVIRKNEGNSVTLPKVEKTLSIEEELLLGYNAYPVKNKFFEKLRIF